jgi:hypothetical protein
LLPRFLGTTKTFRPFFRLPELLLDEPEFPELLEELDELDPDEPLADDELLDEPQAASPTAATTAVAAAAQRRVRLGPPGRVTT